MNKRQRKKRDRLDSRKNIIKGIIATMNKIYGEEDPYSKHILCIVTSKKGKINKEYMLKNATMTFNSSSDAPSDQDNALGLHWSCNPYTNYTSIGTIASYMKSWIEGIKESKAEINPQIWEYGGIKRLEYLFFRYCAQRYAYGKDWTNLTIYDLAEDYIKAYPRNNMKQLLYYIRKWQKLHIVTYNIDPFVFLGCGLDSTMVKHYRDIFTSTINEMKEAKESILFDLSFFE